MHIETIREAVEFPCVPWQMRDARSMAPIAGTWTLAPFEIRQSQGVKGVISCPRCAGAALLPYDMGEKADNLKDLILKRVVCRFCQHECRAIVKDWDTRKLFCAAYETGAGPTLKAHKEYLHAENVEEATACFWAGRLPSDNVTALVGVAMVIGFYVLDEHGKKLGV